MAKSTSLAEFHPQAPVAQAEGKPRKRAPGAFARRAEGLAKELSVLPMKPLLIGAGLGAALLGTALAVSSKRRSPGSWLSGMNQSGMNQTLTMTVLVALARVVSGQTVRSVASSALLDVADTLKR